MTRRYPHRARLRRQRDFRLVVRYGDVFPGREALVRRRPNGLSWARLGIASPRKYGNAVRRNRFRRLVREAFREIQESLGGFDLLVSPRRHLEEPSRDGLERDLRRILTAQPAPSRRKTT